jgi:hypothetical protein
MRGAHRLHTNQHRRTKDQMMELKTDTMQETEFTRFEYIDQKGRVVVKYLKDNEKLSLSVQDDGKTLKVFLSDKE